jgi:hypothetical protein
LHEPVQVLFPQAFLQVSAHLMLGLPDLVLI